MINFSELTQSSGWKNFMAKVNGLGATVVIVGALFKIQHWPGAGVMLTVGLLTEAAIFFFSAFEPIHEEVDWTLVYPELAGMTDEEEISKYKNHHAPISNAHSGGGYSGSDSALAKFDQMIEEAQITPDLFKSLGQGLKDLKETSSQISDITDATAATKDYVSNVKAASSSLGNLTDSYSKSSNDLNFSVDKLSQSYHDTANSIKSTGEQIANKINDSGSNLANQIQSSGDELSGAYKSISETITNDLKSITSNSGNYNEQLDSLNKNLSALNAVYELQLQNNNEQVKNNEALYSEFSSMMDNLKSSVEETKKYKEEISMLHQNLASLNTVYGNMLSAMHVTKQ